MHSTVKLLFHLSRSNIIQHFYPLLFSMNRETIQSLLENVQNGTCTISQALKRLQGFPSEKLNSGCIDHQRQIRTGIPEVVFGQSKTADQVIEITRAMQKQGSSIIITRIDTTKAAQVMQQITGLTYSPLASMLTSSPPLPNVSKYRGNCLIISAGTSDLPVAEEARLTLEMFGHPVQLISDTGVAGLHRLFNHHDELRQASAIIVVAGMEGALPSVVAGLVDSPVIGVPTSVGYGASFGGIAALLGMLNSCAPGVAVVNIDNGFGAACMAEAINRNRK